MRPAWQPGTYSSSPFSAAPRWVRSSAGRWGFRCRSRSLVRRSESCSASILCGCGGSVDGDPVSAVAEDLPAAPERPAPSRAHWLLAMRHLAWLVLILAYPIFALAGWARGAWVLCAAIWTVQRLIQSGVNRFVLDLPPTPAVAVAGIAFLTRAWGTIIALFVSQHIWGSDVAVPAAILFAILYTIDAAARGLAWANSKREPREETT